MTRAQFLNDLYHHLYGLTKEQAEQHLTYYAEMLADRMEEGVTEEEAVAGMEDVETIARRIMEEEGLPYTPPEQRPVPPAYPDASKLQGGGGKRAYQVPRKTNWRRIAQVVLWVVAISVAAGAAKHWIWRHIYSPPSSPTDYTDYSATEAAVPDAPYAEWCEYDYVEAPYVEGYEYSSGEYHIDVGLIDCIDIQWASGMVYVQSWSGDTIQVQEFANSEPNERTAMSCQDDDGTLTIRYRSGIGLGSVKGSKWLTVLIPDGMMYELEIETTSSDIRMNGLELAKLTVSTASGHITPTDCYVQTAALNSISGELILTNLHADTLDASTISGGISGDIQSSDIDVSSTSGDIFLSVLESTDKIRLNTTSGSISAFVEDPSVQSIGVDTVSGYVSIGLPYDTGFTLDYSTTSGNFLPDSGYDLLQQNGRYIHNGGGCEIQVDTISGDLEIY